MTFPTLDLSDGTTRHYLAATHEGAAVAVREALERVRATVPAPADYQDAAEYRDAFRDHLSRVDRLRTVLGELVTLADHCDMEGGAR